jgi:hypothetical protein
VFFAALGTPKAAKEQVGFRASTENHPQVNTSVFDNGLRMQGGIPYNPKVFRNNEIPG